MTIKTFGKAAAVAALVTGGLIGVASAEQTGRQMNGSISFVATGGLDRTTPLQRSGQYSGAAGVKRDFERLPSTNRQSELVIIVTPYLIVPTN